MNKEQLRLWIAALRSGDYQQIKGTLEDNYGYCCLGVACKVLIPADYLHYYESTLRTKLIAGTCPFDQEHAPKWLKDINEYFENIHGVSLITLNDDDGATFTEIADLLEKYYLQDGNQ